MTERVRRLTDRQFRVAMETCGHLYAMDDCGCIVLCMLDIPEIVRDARDDIARESLKGHAMQRAPRGGLPPFNCPTHQAMRDAQKAAR